MFFPVFPKKINSQSQKKAILQAYVACKVFLILRIVHLQRLGIDWEVRPAHFTLKIRACVKCKGQSKMCGVQGTTHFSEVWEMLFYWQYLNICRTFSKLGGQCPPSLQGKGLVSAVKVTVMTYVVYLLLSIYACNLQQKQLQKSIFKNDHLNHSLQISKFSSEKKINKQQINK